MLSSTLSLGRKGINNIKTCQIMVYYAPRYAKVVKEHAPNPAPPEARLPPAQLGSFMFMIRYVIIPFYLLIALLFLFWNSADSKLPRPMMIQSLHFRMDVFPAFELGWANHCRRRLCFWYSSTLCTY